MPDNSMPEGYLSDGDGQDGDDGNIWRRRHRLRYSTQESYADRQARLKQESDDRISQMRSTGFTPSGDRITGWSDSRTPMTSVGGNDNHGILTNAVDNWRFKGFGPSQLSATAATPAGDDNWRFKSFGPSQLGNFSGGNVGDTIKDVPTAQSVAFDAKVYQQQHPVTGPGSTYATSPDAPSHRIFVLKPELR